MQIIFIRIFSKNNSLFLMIQQLKQDHHAKKNLPTNFILFLFYPKY